MGPPLDRLTLALAWTTAVLAVAMLAVSPAAAGALPPGFVTPVLVLELATDPSWLDAVLGDPATASSRVDGWVLASRLDFGFMTAYAALLGASAVQRGVGRVAVPLAAGVWLADLVETTALLDLLLAWSLGAASPQRYTWGVLAVATWTKWIGLGVTLAWLARTFEPRVGWVVALPLPLSLLALVGPAPLAEGMAAAVLLAFVVLIGAATRRWRAAGA